LAIAEPNWKSKKEVDTVGGMIGIYLLERSEQKISIDHCVKKEPKFLPVMELKEEYLLQNINPNGYFIMPSTYRPKISG